MNWLPTSASTFAEGVDFTLWLVTIIYTAIWTFENPERIEKFKDAFKKNQKAEIKAISGESKNVVANAFTLKLTQVLENSSKTAFVTYPKNIQIFDPFNLTIFKIIKHE